MRQRVGTAWSCSSLWPSWPLLPEPHDHAVSGSSIHNDARNKREEGDEVRTVTESAAMDSKTQVPNFCLRTQSRHSSVGRA